MKLIISSFYSFMGFLLLLLFAGCSLKNPTFTSRLYHNTTAKYNAYFNGKESLKAGVQELSKTHQDNFNEILPVFPVGDLTEAQAVAGKMDVAIKKGAIVIKKHSFAKHSKKKEESCKWIDDAYMLMGKSYFYKQDYGMAANTFIFVMETYPKNDIVYEAMLWLVRTKNQKKEFDNSLALLQQVENKLLKNQGTKEATKLLPLVSADYYIQQEDYAMAIEHLLRGIDLNRNKKVRARLYYILAQIKQLSGQNGEASNYYKEVIKLNPSYIMQFNAKINLARCYDSKKDQKLIVKQLEKMAKDVKNKEYTDQIYYALAKIYLTDKDTTKAIPYLEKSGETSVQNKYQKAISYLLLGDIYLNKTDYLKAQIYYDSTSIYYPKEDKNYGVIYAKSITLKELAKHANTIQVEDSLQRLAKLTPKELNRSIDRIIAEIIKKEEDKKREEVERQKQLNALKQNQQGVAGAKDSWYFYNPTSLKFGYNEFKTKWGDRPLEDLWRLKNKQTDDSNIGIKEMEIDSSKTVDESVFDPKNRNSYLALIPSSPEKLELSNQKLILSYYLLGNIYNDKLVDYVKAGNTFYTLIQRFPGNEYELKAAYQGYDIYKNKAIEVSKALFFEQLILTKYPQSEYAQLIKDPNYYKIMIEKAKEVDKHYARIFDQYCQGKSAEVISACQAAYPLYPTHAIVPKLKLLEAMAIGKSQSKESYIAALESVKTTYASTVEGKHAASLLEALTPKELVVETNKEAQLMPDENKVKKVAREFTFDEKSIHLCIIVVDIRHHKVADIKEKVADFNTATYPVENLTVSSSILNDTQQLVIVSNFKGAALATTYFSSLTLAGSLPESILNQSFIITTSNYSKFRGEKNTDRYVDFYQRYYPKK